MSLKSIIYKDRFLLSLFNLDVFPPKVITKFERGSIRFHLSASKESYDKLGLKKAANNTMDYFNKCQLCKCYKKNLCSMWFHLAKIDHGVSSVEVKNALEQKEKESLEYQLSIKRNQN